MKKLSIIVPVYNVEKYVEQCIRSLYEQDIPQEEYEVICVDDCTPDGSCAIIERLQSEYPTLRLLHHERNRKLGSARNSGIRAAMGRYILFVDSDDMLVPNCLGHLINEMEATRADFIHFDRCKTKDGVSWKECYSLSADTKLLSGPDLFFMKELDWTKQVTAWCKIYRTDFICANDLYFVDDIMYEDNDYVLRVTAAAKQCKHIHFAPYVYRVNDSSIMHSKITSANLLYWQITWKQLLSIWSRLVSVDKRYDEFVLRYLRYDLYDLLNHLKEQTKADRIMVKKAMSIVDWYRVIRLLPIKQRLTYIIQLIKA